MQLNRGQVLTLAAVLVAASSSDQIFASELRPPVISIAGIHSPTLSGGGVQLICSVRVENPNDVKLPIKDGSVNLKLADSPAAKGRLLKPVTIPSRGVQDVDVLATLTITAAASWLPLFFGGEAFSLPFEVIGHVDVDLAGLGRVPFHESGQVVMTDEGLRID